MVKKCGSSFEREIAEAVLIKRWADEGMILLNNKEEYNRCIIPELTVRKGNKIALEPDEEEEIKEKKRKKNKMRDTNDVRDEESTSSENEAKRDEDTELPTKKRREESPETSGTGNIAALPLDSTEYRARATFKQSCNFNQSSKVNLNNQMESRYVLSDFDLKQGEF